MFLARNSKEFGHPRQLILIVFATGVAQVQQTGAERGKSLATQATGAGAYLKPTPRRWVAISLQAAPLPGAAWWVAGGGRFRSRAACAEAPRSLHGLAPRRSRSSASP